LGVAPSVTGGFTNITKVVGGTGTTDTLIGPIAIFDQTSWTLTGANAGIVDLTAFSGFENLTGQASSNDAFVFATGGSISGTIDGGAGSRDGFAFLDGSGNLSAYQPTTADQGGTYSGVTFSGMDPYTPLGGSAANRVITGPLF